MKQLACYIVILAALWSATSTALARNQKTPDHEVQEKIVMELDKPGYVTGDTIRFHASLIDAATGKPLRDFSRYLYVELIDPFGQTVNRVKIKQRNGIFPGIIPLDRELPESRYTLAAYTMFMQNIPSDYFYRQPIDIASVYGINNRIDCSLEGNSLEVSMTDKRSGRPIECSILSIIGPDKSKEPIRTLYNRTSIKGKVKEDMPVVKVSLDHYSKFIPLPASAADYQLELYPEGGALVPGVVNAVVFRAIDHAGRWLDTEGYVENAAGERVADLRSGHSGYGVFYLNPEESDEYYAVVGEQRVKLPEVSAANATLQVQTVRKDQLIVTSAGNVPDGSRVLIERAGKPLLGVEAGKAPQAVNRSKLGEGLLKIWLVSPDGTPLSNRLVYNHSQKESQLRDDLKLLEQDLHHPVDSIEYYAAPPAHMMELDAMLLANKSDRYAPQSELRYPVEIGGEISGVIRSRWKGKPIEGATINVIAPAINFGMEAKTDSEGRFYVNGFDWPDGTAFVCQALGKKGQQEHNFTVTRDEFPDVKPLPLRSEIAREDPFEVLYAGYVPEGIMLDELVVTAKADDEEVRKVMMKALGVRSMDINDFRERSITTYEEAVFNIPQLSIRNGAIVSNRSAGINNPFPPVEIWIDGARWEPIGQSSTSSSSAMRTRARKTARIMTGNILPGDVAEKVYTAQFTSLQELSSTLPFSDVATFEYVPPQLALALSGTAAHTGGAIVITTKAGSGVDWSRDIFKQVHMPLGYQQEPAALRPWASAE